MTSTPATSVGDGPGGVTEVDLLRALAHPVRLGIVQRLAREPETCACDFTDVFAVTQPTISQHLKVLREAGLVRTRRRGTQICYSLRPESVGRLHDLLDTLHTDAGSRPRLGRAAGGRDR